MKTLLYIIIITLIVGCGNIQPSVWRPEYLSPSLMFVGGYTLDCSKIPDTFWANKRRKLYEFPGYPSTYTIVKSCIKNTLDAEDVMNSGFPLGL